MAQTNNRPALKALQTFQAELEPTGPYNLNRIGQDAILSQVAPPAPAAPRFKRTSSPSLAKGFGPSL